MGGAVMAGSLLPYGNCAEDGGISGSSSAAIHVVRIAIPTLFWSSTLSAQLTKNYFSPRLAPPESPLFAFFRSLLLVHHGGQHPSGRVCTTPNSTGTCRARPSTRHTRKRRL